MKRHMIAACAAALLWVSPAAAQDRLIDTTQPAVLAKALQDAGYKGEFKTRDNGTFYIASGANGSNFTIEFFDCNKGGGKQCDSFQFFSWYKKEPHYSLELVNRWNLENRFLKAVLDKDGDISTFADVTSVGKLTYANFVDSVKWWSDASASLSKFLDEGSD